MNAPEDLSLQLKIFHRFSEEIHWGELPTGFLVTTSKTVNQCIPLQSYFRSVKTSNQMTKVIS
jgi:hypothetical protein